MGAPAAHARRSQPAARLRSPRVRSRVEGGNIFGISPAEVYRSGCRDVTNHVILPQGGAYRREGFQFRRDTNVDVPTVDGSVYREFTLVGEVNS